MALSKPTKKTSMKQYNNRNELSITGYEHILFAVCSTAERNLDNVHFLELMVKKKEKLKKLQSERREGKKEKTERKDGRQNQS
jgi:hypothetical protein